MIHSFLIVGQSNMAGRGFLAEAEPLDNCDGRLKNLRNGRWQIMHRPINPDRHTSGTCLAESFAKAYAEAHPDVEVGIIPCADGGTSADQWAEGSLLFDNAVNCARLAMRTSHLVGILWHQGESDCEEHLYPCYFDKVKAIMAAFRRALGDDGLPIVVGGLGEFLKERTSSPELTNYTHINADLIRLAEQTDGIAFAPADGLSANPDNLHFSHAALKEFGLRYYAAFRTVENKNRIFDDSKKSIDGRRSAMELL